MTGSDIFLHNTGQIMHVCCVLRLKHKVFYCSDICKASVINRSAERLRLSWITLRLDLPWTTKSRRVAFRLSSTLVSLSSSPHCSGCVCADHHEVTPTWFYMLFTTQIVSGLVKSYDHCNVFIQHAFNKYIEIFYIEIYSIFLLYIVKQYV